MGAPFNLKLLDPAAPAEIVSSPSYTDIFHETLGTAATDQDDFANHLAKLTALVDSFQSEVDTTSQGGEIAGAVAALGNADPAPLDATIANYAGTIPTGKQFVSDGQSLAPPRLLELPISPSSGGVPAAPPTLTAHDFGILKLGSGPHSFELGTSVYLVNGQSLGLLDVQLINYDQLEWAITSTEHDTVNGDQHITWYITVTPAVLGKSTAQVNTNKVNNTQYTIYTFTVDVVP
jgi:hypothetical protein